MDVPRSSSEVSPSTAATTPERLASSEDDIWASDSEEITGDVINSSREPLLSDLPTLKRQHMTDGYREGLSIGKAKVMQSGFDQGFPVGVKIGLRVGRILGSLQGILAAKSLPIEIKGRLQKLLDQAQKELAITSLLKDVNDQILTSSIDLPTKVDSVITRWEMTLVASVSPTGEGVTNERSEDRRQISS